MKTFVEVGIKAGLKGQCLERYVIYMWGRWAKKEELQCATGYAWEWAERFKAKVEYGCSDTVGQTLLDQIDHSTQKARHDSEEEIKAELLEDQGGKNNGKN